MPSDKKGFLLYTDQKELFTKLSNKQAGQLIKHIFSYINNEDPTTDNLLIEIAFTPIKQQLKRDIEKYENIKEKRIAAGKASGESRRKKSTKDRHPEQTQWTRTKRTPVQSAEQTRTKRTVIDNVNVNVNVKDIKKINIAHFETFWKLYPRKTGKQKAKESWIKICQLKNKNLPKFSKLKKAIKNQNKSNQWQDSKYIPHPATWLNQHRWLDIINEFDNTKTKPTNRNSSRSQTDKSIDYSHIKSKVNKN